MRRGPPDSSPQQTGTSRTVKRYPSSSGPITSNALPGGNGYTNGLSGEHRNWHGHRNGQSGIHSFNAHRPNGDSQLYGQFNNALLPAGKAKKSSVSIPHGETDVVELFKTRTLNISTVLSHVKANTILFWLSSQRLRYIHAHPVVSSPNGTLATRKKTGSIPGCSSPLPLSAHATPSVVCITPN